MTRKKCPTFTQKVPRFHAITTKDHSLLLPGEVSGLFLPYQKWCLGKSLPILMCNKLMIKSQGCYLFPSEILQFFSPLIFKKILNFIPILKSHVSQDTCSVKSQEADINMCPFTHNRGIYSLYLGTQVWHWTQNNWIQEFKSGFEDPLPVPSFLPFYLPFLFLSLLPPSLFPSLSLPLFFSIFPCGMNSGSLLVMGRWLLTVFHSHPTPLGKVSASPLLSDLCPAVVGGTYNCEKSYWQD